MRRLIFSFAAACAALAAAILPAAAVDHNLSGYAGTYNCVAGNDH